MIDGETSKDAKMLAHFSTIFQSENCPKNRFGIHFVNVDGKNVVQKHSWANIIEAQVVSNFHHCFTHFPLH